MAIIVVLLSLLVPAMNNFGSTYGRRGAVNTVMNTLEQARAAALQSGETVHVVFRRRQFPDPDAILVLREADTATATPRYEALTRWITLPKGVLLHDPKVKNILQSDLADSTFDEAQSPVKLDRADGSLFNVLSFNPRGGVAFPGDKALLLVLTEGVRGSGNSVALLNAGPGKNIFEIISLRRFTGRASLEVTAL